MICVDIMAKLNTDNKIEVYITLENDDKSITIANFLEKNDHSWEKKDQYMISASTVSDVIIKHISVARFN